MEENKETSKNSLFFILGPLFACIIFIITSGVLHYSGRIVISTFVLVVFWWITHVVPWGITALLPLAIFPLSGITTLNEAIHMYAQEIFFWVSGVVLLGYAINKYGIANYLASFIFKIKFFTKSISHWIFGYMAAVYIVSMFISDAATVAIMLPLGLSIINLNGMKEEDSLKSIIALSALYASVSGGLATICGAPHNAMVVSLMEKYLNVKVGFFDWFMLGLPISLCILLASFVTIKVIFLRKVSPVSQHSMIKVIGNNIVTALTKEQAVGTRNVIAIFILVISIWLVPGAVSLILGEDNFLTTQLTAALPIWIAPILASILLLITPVDIKIKKFTLEWKELIEHGALDLSLLATGGVVLGNSLKEFGLVDLLMNKFSSLPIPSFILIVLVFVFLIILTNTFSGTASVSIFAIMLFPFLENLGYDPLIFGICMAALGVGLIFPWAGAAAATSFAIGNPSIKIMMTTGCLITGIILATVLGINFFVGVSG